MSLRIIYALMKYQAVLKRRPTDSQYFLINSITTLMQILSFKKHYMLLINKSNFLARLTFKT